MVGVAVVAGLATAGAGVGFWAVSRPGNGAKVSAPGQASSSTGPASAPAAVTAAPATTGPPATMAPVTIAPGVAALGESCSNTEEGFAISYPTAWSAERNEPHWLCARFDPNTLDQVPPNSELPQTAVIVIVSQTTFADTVKEMTDPSNYDVLSSSDRTIAGRRGLALETVQTRDLALPAGTRYYRILVDRGSATAIVETNSTAPDSYAVDRLVVAAMAETLRLN
jgi:hypothetical protein